MTTLALLKASVNRNLHRTFDDDVLEGFIDNTGIAIGRDAQLFEQDASTTVASSSTGLAPSDIAADFSILTSIKYSTDGQERFLRAYTPDQAAGVFAYATHRPTGYKWEAGKLYILPHRDETLTINYQQRIPALSDLVMTNDILTNWPEVYEFGATYRAALQMQDDDAINKYRELYDEHIAKLAAYAEAQRLGAYTQIRSV